MGLSELLGLRPLLALFGIAGEPGKAAASFADPGRKDRPLGAAARPSSQTGWRLATTSSWLTGLSLGSPEVGNRLRRSPPPILSQAQSRFVPSRSHRQKL